MTIEIAFVLIIIGIAFILFSTEFVPVDVTALIILGILLITGMLSIDDGLSGFSNPAVITIACLFIISFTIQKEGILEYVILNVTKLIEKSRVIGFIVYLLSISIASAIMNNTAIVAIFIPVTIRLANRFKISPSKVLIPLSYAAILGGTLTLIGTSTNLLVNSIFVEKGGYTSIGMFEFTRFGMIYLAIGMIYIFTVIPHLIPSRIAESSLTKNYDLGAYLTEIKITDDSPLVGNTCLSRSINKNYDVTVLNILREGKLITTNIRNQKIQKDDTLFVRGSLDGFLRMKELERVTLLTDEKLTEKELEQEENILVEGILTDRSRLIGRSSKSINFRRRYGAFILAIRREGTILRDKIANLTLKAHDTLLIYGPMDSIQNLAKSIDFILIGEVHVSLNKHRFWWMSIAVLFIAVLLAAFGIIPIVKGVLIGVVILLAFGVIEPADAYRAISWQVIILLAALIPLGHVIRSSGTATWIGESLFNFMAIFPSDYQPFVMVSLIYLITTILTEVSSNAATAILMTPIALVVSAKLGLDPRPFIFSICFAASASFITPIGYQTNLMVYGPGGYKFTDYIRTGMPLAIILWIVATIFIPIFWPFKVL
ncbi:SLC13 family permease [Candidatus Neomarinimicrobiota bacterium]